VISAADVAAVAATNCRRESFFRDMAFPPWWANRKCLKSRSCCSASQAGLGPAEISLTVIRAELMASVEKPDA
jgi:hypothetical protein